MTHASSQSMVAEPAVQVSLSAEDALGLALNLIKERDFEQAEHVCSVILERCPEHVEALNTLSLVAIAREQYPSAIEYIERALELAPHLAKLHNNLGFVRAARGQHEAAARAYERAVQRSSATADYHVNLASAYKRLGHLDMAQDTYQGALALDPQHVVALQGLAEICASRGEYDRAIASLKTAVQLEPRNIVVRSYLAYIYRALGEQQLLEELFRAWQAEDPEGAPVARHMLAACTGENVPARASDRYVEQLFDACAADFDEHLVHKLHYGTPRLCVEAFARHMSPPASELDIIDLGCGTGLCGPLFAPWARVLEGVDLSAGMLARARSKHVYADLHLAELTAFLDRVDARWHAAVCADTLCYFGELESPLMAAYRTLRPGGTFVFSVEALEDTDTQHRLERSGRYKHSRTYVERVLAEAGFALLEWSACALRSEADAPVPGFVVVARRPV